MSWLDRFPLLLVALITIPLAVAPFPLEPEVHLWQKITMLLDGTLTASTDIGDLVLHLIPTLLIVTKIYREATRASRTPRHEKV